MIVRSTEAWKKACGAPVAEHLQGMRMLIDGFDAQMTLRVEGPAEEAFQRLGRTEDVRFSPGNRKIAIAGYLENSCFIFDVTIERSGHRPLVRIEDYLEIRSSALKEPHGFDFIDDGTLAVANRAGRVAIFKIPPDGAGRVHWLNAARIVRRVGLRDKVRSPGSLCVARVHAGRATVYVCNNYADRITRHEFPRPGSLGFCRNDVMLEKTMAIPDGIAISPDQTRLAISNHGTASVSIFDSTHRLSRAASPIGCLSGVSYPHGLRFTPDGKGILVADAGRPVVALYRCVDGSWRGEHEPVAVARVLDEDTFLRGHVNPTEGGPKGLDMDATGEVLAITCEEKCLAFFHMPSLFGQALGHAGQ
jgi:hypothetical protein